MMEIILQHLAALVAIDTRNPPRSIMGDGPLVQYLKQNLPQMNFEVQVDDLGDGHVNIFAVRGEPAILFNVHLDTVPAAAGWTYQPWRLTQANDRVYGLGACDIKGAAACLLALAASHPDLPMAVLFSTDEEGANVRCVNHFCQSGQAKLFKQVIVAEPTGCRAVLAHRGYLSVVGRFEGRAGHSSAARALQDNAIHRACLWANAAVQLAAREQQTAHVGYAGLCFNLGRFDGGVKSNVIADAAEVRWSVRLRPGDDTEAWYQKFIHLPAGEHAHWSRPFLGPPLPVREEETQCALQFAHEHQLDIADHVDFWTEASLFSAAGIPALVLGPGDIRQAHCADEWVSLAHLQRAYELYLGLIKRQGHG